MSEQWIAASPVWHVSRRTAVAALLGAALVGWFGQAWWSDHQEERHCQMVAEQEVDLMLGTFEVETDSGTFEVDDELSEGERRRYLGNVQRELEKCAARGWEPEG